MNTTAKAHEPTMEEILASIRRIISDDEPAPTAKGPAPLKSVEKPKAGEAEPAAALGQDDIDAMLASFDEPEPEPAPKPAPAKPEPATRFEPAPKLEPARLPIADTRIHLGGDVDVFELTDEMAADPEPEPAWEPEPAPPPPPRGPEMRQAPFSAERLTSPSTDEAVGAAFGTLAHTMLSNNGRTIDDVVKEMLRPMLRAWLDDNLPPLVERLVRQEIERVARGR